MSGLATLVLTEAEIKMIDQHHKETLRRILRLQEKNQEVSFTFCRDVFQEQRSSTFANFLYLE